MLWAGAWRLPSLLASYFLVVGDRASSRLPSVPRPLPGEAIDGALTGLRSLALLERRANATLVCSHPPAPVHCLSRARAHRARRRGSGRGRAVGVGRRAVIRRVAEVVVREQARSQRGLQAIDGQLVLEQLHL